MKVRLVHLSKGFSSARGDILAVDDVHVEIEDKEFFVLLGPSGCGKSTVLNLIAGLEKPTRGEIWFGDKLVASGEKRGAFLAPRERNVAMVFQSYALYPHLSVFDNIAFPLRIAGENKDSIRQSVEKAAATLGISNLFGAKPGELSGGQRQRVAIARAIVRQPSIFLLDEPLSNLDALLRTSTRTELKNLQRNLGITAVYVTHDQVEAMSLGDRIALLKDGRLEQTGAPEDLYERPANSFVARFIGSPPMNLLKASFLEEHDQLWLVVNGKKFKVPDTISKSIKERGARECVFGIRPEDIHPRKGKGNASLRAEISQVESLGRETLIHLFSGDQEFSVLTGDKRTLGLEAGGSMELVFDLTKAHFFEAQGKQLSLLE